MAFLEIVNTMLEAWKYMIGAVIQRPVCDNDKRQGITIFPPRGKPRLSLTMTSILAFCLSGIFWSLFAGQSPDLEYKVKGIFIYNFTKFVQWPSDALEQSDTLTIGFWGENRFGTALDLFNDKTVFGKPVKIKHLRSISEAESCHLLFISASEKKTTLTACT